MYLPYALEQKYPQANREWKWQFVFPANNRSKDPRSGIVRRHHIYPDSLQRAVKSAIRQAEITKHASCHTLRLQVSARIRSSVWLPDKKTVFFLFVFE